MMFLTTLHVVFLVSQLEVPIFSQNVQGRYARPNYQKCDQRNGCSSIDVSSFESDTKHEAADGYRSIRIGGSPNISPDFKKEVVSGTRPSRVNFEHQSSGKYSDDSSAGDYNRTPLRDRTVHVSKPVGDDYSSLHHDRDGGYDASSMEVSHNFKPDRNSDSYNSKSILNPNLDPNKLKQTRISSSGYYLRPDRYVPKPVDDDYRPKPEISKEEDFYRPIPDVNRRPKNGSRPRPIPQKEYPKPDNSEAVPNYPNADLGGYNDPKDDDYNDTPKKNEDHTVEEKPIPVVDGNCVCVPYYQCREGHIVTDGAGIIDARRKPEPEEDLPLDGKFKPPSCGPFHVCCNTPETSTVKPYEHKCGVRNPSGINSRILSPSNKGEADFGEWPWQAAVLKSEGKVNIFQCGGVLIDKFHVLTVAHCVFHLYKSDEYPLKVRLGEWDTQTTSEFLAHDDYRVSKIIVHPEFRNTSLWNDVAILRLEEAVVFAPHIDTICLPKYDEIFAQQNCVVTGWGKDAYKGGTFLNIMKELALQVIDNYQCEEMLRKTRLGRFFQLHDGFLCAGGEYGLDSCKGDGGGPLVCYRKDKSYALAGIVSWGIDCGQPGVPGVYVKIQKYLDWISKTTGVYLEDYWPKQ